MVSNFQIWGLAKLGDMLPATLSQVTCPLNVSQFSHLRNSVAGDKMCSERHTKVSGRQQKHVASPWLGGYFACLSLACLATLEDTPNTIFPSLARALDIRNSTDFQHFGMKNSTDFRCIDILIFWCILFGKISCYKVGYSCKIDINKVSVCSLGCMSLTKITKICSSPGIKYSIIRL